nr:hypothetical protein [uncultured Oscillibacter sp.]
MKYADINAKYTATVAGYLAKGYTINTRSMCGSQGDYAHIDLTDGTEVIRIMVDTFHEWTDISLDGLEIIVGRADSEVIPNCENDYYTLWNTKLDIISRERFYEIGADRRHGKFYGTLEEAIAAQQLKVRRYIAKHQDSKTEDITPRAMEIAKRIIRREFKVKRICESDITVTKYNGAYTIKYKSRVYRLH